MEGDGGPIIVGGARYIVGQPGTAEVAFAVVDEHQGQGIGAALMRHLTVLSRRAGLRELVAEVLPDNVPMLTVLEKSGLRMTRKRTPEAVHIALSLERNKRIVRRRLG
jgi:RimJ/RimL family protein N-acetyltransferase